MGDVPEIHERASSVSVGTGLEPAWRTAFKGYAGKPDYLLCRQLF